MQDVVLFNSGYVLDNSSSPKVKREQQWPGMNPRQQVECVHYSAPNTPNKHSAVVMGGKCHLATEKRQAVITPRNERLSYREKLSEKKKKLAPRPTPSKGIRKMARTILEENLELHVKHTQCVVWYRYTIGIIKIYAIVLSIRFRSFTHLKTQQFQTFVSSSFL